MTPCVSAEHHSDVPAEFLWWASDGHRYDYCAECVGWFLLGALYDPGMEPRGVDLLPGTQIRTVTAEDKIVWCADDPYEDGEAA